MESMMSKEWHERHPYWKLLQGALGEFVTYLFDNGKRRVEVQFAKEKRPDGKRVWGMRRYAAA